MLGDSWYELVPWGSLETGSWLLGITGHIGFYISWACRPHLPMLLSGGAISYLADTDGFSLDEMWGEKSGVTSFSSLLSVVCFVSGSSGTVRKATPHSCTIWVSVYWVYPVTLLQTSGSSCWFSWSWILRIMYLASEAFATSSQRIPALFSLPFSWESWH